jgi:hypothetical protein
MEQIKCIIFIQEAIGRSKLVEAEINKFFEDMGDVKIVSMNTVICQNDDMKIVILYK